MRCEDFDELIHLFWDGRIDEEKREGIEKHLSTCKRCKEKLALLESIEKGAKGIKIKEPSPEYWDTFSSRVRERIVAQREESFSFKLKKVFESFFTFSPLKVKIAAGVISIVFVFIVGKLYVDYRGKEIVPTAPKMERRKIPAFYAPELKEEVASLEEKEKEKKKIALPADELEKGEAPQVIPEERITPVTPLEEKMRKKDEIAPPGEIEKTEAPQIISEEETTPEVSESKEEKVLLPEVYSTGAGVEEGKKREMVKPEQKAEEQEGVPLKGVTKTAAREPSFLALDRAVEIPPAEDYYIVNDEKIQKVKEEDTLLQEDVLRKTIDSWNRYIEKSPKDSLANEGYLQVAIAYYLLTKLTQDESDLANSIEILEKYEKQVTDPKTKEELNKKLKQLKALKEK